MATTNWTQEAGMTSDADTDNIESYAEQAAASETAAQASEDAAATSASAASTSASQAASSASAAASSASDASSSAGAAASSASGAATSATNAATSASAAASSATSAASSATNAATSATNAAASETAAAASETAAAASETAAAASETAAAASETAAAASETAAAASETAAASSASAASASATNASTSASSAATSASSAVSSATAASSSETAAAASAAAASTSEANAAASETAAASSASSASASADAALAALDSFDDRYLGQKASDPTLDNDGNALVAGALYFNTTDDVMKVYEGSLWVAAYASLSGALLSANNLSDLANVAAARTNLGLGTAATTASTDYATAAQGALADSALQSADIGVSVQAYNANTVIDAAYVHTDNNYTTTEKSKLAGIEAGADVTDTINVTAAGALMDSEVTNLAAVKSFDPTDYAAAVHTHTKSDITDFSDADYAAAVHTHTKSDITDFSDADYAAAVHTHTLSDITDAGTAAASAATDFVAVTGDTMTGNLDVQGTVTADGLTVDGVSTFTSNVFISHNATPLLRLEDTDTALDFDLLTAGSNATIRTKNGAYPLLLQTNELNRVLVSGGGNISFYEDTGTTPKLFWDASDEQLMLGTTTDTNSLDSSLILQGGGANAYGKLFIANENTALGSTDAIGFVGFGDANKVPSSFIGVYADGTWTSGSSQPSRFSISTTPTGSASSVERLRIDSSGNVGIGTSPETSTSTYKALELGYSTSILARTAANQSYFGNNAYHDTSWKYKTTDPAALYQQVDDQHVFFNAASGAADTTISFSEAMRIDSSGNLLVGTTTTNISNSTSATGTVVNAGGWFEAAYTNVVSYLNRLGSDGDIVHFRKDGSTMGSIGTEQGDLYVGTGDTGVAFYDAGDALIPFNTSTRAYRDAGIDFGNSSYRFKDLYLSGTANAANFNTTSDATLKTNVETLTGSLDAVKALRGVSFEWTESGNPEVGVIAQEVEAVIPELVSTNDQGIKSVKYGNVVAVLIEAIKEQQAQIDELKAKLGD